MNDNIKLTIAVPIIGISSLIGLIYWKTRVPEAMKDIPSIPVWPLIKQSAMGVPFIETSENFKHLYNEHKMLRMFFKGEWQIMNGDAELFKKIAMDPEHFDKLTPHDFAPNCLIDQLLGSNIVFSNYRDWKKHRRVVNPAFKKSWNLNVFTDCVEELFEKMANMQLKNLDIDDLIQRVTVEALGREIMDVRFDGILPEKKAQLISDFNQVMDTGLNPIYFIFPMFDSPWNPFRSSAYKKMKFINSYFDQLIHERKAKIEQSKDEINHKDILSLMLQSNMNDSNGLTDDDIKHDTLIFFVAGQDTTTFTICATLHLLAEHPDIQEKVRKEVLSVFGRDEYENGKLKTPTHDQLNSLEYLQAVIHESMRLYPAVSLISNQICIKEFTHNGYVIPAKTMIDTNVYAIHRNPNYFKDPDTFDPTRFYHNLDTNKLDSKWFGFSAGSRKCLGSAFTNIEQKIVLSYILRRYLVKPSGSLPSGKPLKVKTPFLLKPDNLRLDFEPINYNNS